jgi:hypothetical protein
MSSARFWYLPLKDVAPEQERAQLAAREEIDADDLRTEYAVPAKLFHEGIRAGDVLALHDGDKVVALARVLALDNLGALHWRRLPLLTASTPVATPELSEVEAHEREKFTVGIDALLRDLPATSSAASSSAVVLPGPAVLPPSGPTRNLILYGPPGTGKTFSVVDRALLLIDEPWYRAHDGDRAALAARFRLLQQQGRIAMVTFHQSYGYEEFIEGLRPEVDEATGNVTYELKDGALKRMAFRALAKGLVKPPKGPGEISFETIWARFTEFVAADEARLYKSKQGLAYLGWMSRNGGFQIQRSTDEQGTTLLIASRLQMKKVWDARQKLGEPKDVTAGDLSNVVGKGAVQSTVQWIAYERLFNLAKDVTPATVVQVDVVEEVQAALDGEGGTFSFAGVPQYVLIVDEINRGNISKILGELITLIEPDKRISMPEELRLPLAYSPDSLFGLPPNLHIIGTMNTADRSIALLDMALRRRFEFEEIGPSAAVLERELAAVESKRLRALVCQVFSTLNQRIRFLYDDDHQLGHALFTRVRSYDDLRRVLVDRVVPLVREYFHGQWEKVGLVFGSYKSPGSLRARADEFPPVIVGTVLNEKAVLGFAHDDFEDEKVEYALNPDLSASAESQLLERFMLGILSPTERAAFADKHKGTP